jgi:hypothetical protein
VRGRVLELLEAVGDRLALEVRRRTRDLDERELERQARVAALAHVVDGHREQVAEPETVASPSWFAWARSRSRVSSVSGSESGTSPMCWTSRVAQVLEQIGDEPAEVLALLGELLEERQRAAVSRSITKSQSRKSASSSTAPRSCSTAAP